jgi:hypothetical protein
VRAPRRGTVALVRGEQASKPVGDERELGCREPGAAVGVAILLRDETVRRFSEQRRE